MLKSGFGMGGVVDRTLPNDSKLNTLVPDSIVDTNEKWMTHALLEAMNGIGWASPNPSVGCVIVKNEKIISSGFTHKYGGKHAERMAFEALEAKFDLNQLSNLEVYLTLEPCSHYGKQPPCVSLLLHPAVKKVVIGSVDKNPKVNGEGIRILKDSGKTVVLDVLKNETEAWHFPFLKFQERKKPLWIAKWAENQEGFLADASGSSKWITNQYSRAHSHWLRQKYDAILVGAGTWLKDSPSLTVRDCALPHHRNPIIFIHDPKNQLKSTSVSKNLYVFNQSSVGELVSAIETTDFGFELQSVFCEGGARTLNELFKGDYFNVVHRFIGQKEFGASKHRITDFNQSKWTQISAINFDNDLLQEWIK